MVDILGVMGSGVLVLLVPVLVLRLVSLPLLFRTQQSARLRALAARDGGGPSNLGWAVACGEAVVQLGVAVGVYRFLDSSSVIMFDAFGESVVTGDGLWLARESGLAVAVAQPVSLTVSILVLLAWLLLCFRTQRKVLTLGMPEGTWALPSIRGRVNVLLGLRLVLGLVLPLGVVLAALVFQAVALVAAGRFRSAVHVAAAVPPAAAQPGTFGPPVGYTPPVPSFQPTPPAYVPTQAGTVAAPQVAHQELHPNEPRTIGGYHLLGRIGSGGMGTVYLARREGAATQVALKTINPELLDHDELLRRFQREAEVLAMVPGAYTARVLDAGLDAGRPYLAMELLDGRPLDAHLREQGPIRSPEALRALALALAVALSGIHRLGLVHRDLKPGNIMLTSAGPRLLDFGIAAIVDGTRLTRSGGGPGTLTYMAPEQFGDEPVGTAADIWAWACCVVCAAHGASPFAGTSTGAVIRKIVDSGPEPSALAAVQALDPALAAAVARALTIDPAARPADGAALLDLLTAYRGAEDAEAVRGQITQGWRTLAL